MEYVEFTARINDGKIDVPQKYRDGYDANVKVILTKKSKTAGAPKKEETYGFGALHDYANPALWDQEEGAFRRAMVKKHADD